MEVECYRKHPSLGVSMIAAEGDLRTFLSAKGVEIESVSPLVVIQRLGCRCKKLVFE